LDHIALFQVTVCFYFGHAAHYLMSWDARVDEVSMAVFDHLDIRSADRASNDLDQGSILRALRVGQILQLEDAWRT
jgi:hypothetical protein